MRLGNFDCGCDNRKEIMFDRGNLGVPEAAFMLVFFGILTAAVIYRRKS